VGSTAVARGLDSRGNDAFGGDVGEGVHADALLPAEDCPVISAKMHGDECVLAVEGTDSSCLYVCEIA